MDKSLQPAIMILNFFKKISSAIRGKSEQNDSFNQDPAVRMTNSYIDSDAIESLSKASIKLDEKFGIKSSGRCGICVKAVDTDEFKEMKAYVDKFLSIATSKDKIGIDISYRSMIDDYGYLWFILKGNKLEDLISSITAIGDTIHEKGFSKQLLATVFEFTSGYGDYSDKSSEIESTSSQYLIYNDKTDKFYPFVPIGNTTLDPNLKKRNHPQEIKLMDELSNEIRIEKDLSVWFPIWNIPF